VAAVCVLNTGLVGKVLLLGAARRQANKWSKEQPSSLYRRRSSDCSCNRTGKKCWENRWGSTEITTVRNFGLCTYAVDVACLLP
jgi:hypothetical protein